MKFKLFVLAFLVFGIFLAVPEIAPAQDFRFPLFQPGTVKNGNILGTDGTWRPVSETGQSVVTANQARELEPVKKVVVAQPDAVASAPVNPVKKPVASASSGKTNKNCPPGWVPSFGKCPEEKWNPWNKEKCPYLYYEHVGVKLSRGLGENEGITIHQK